MDLKLLKTFAEVAANGSYARTAAVAGVAQSALSRQVSALERMIDGRLFHRTGRGVVLTELGERMLPRARALIADADAFEQAARNERALPQGEVTLGVVPIASRGLIAAIAGQLRLSHPRIRLRALEAYSGQVEEWLAAGRVEIAHAQYYGWALRNRRALMPTRDQVMRAMQEMESIRPRYVGRLVIDMVVPDYYARRPKACVGGWGRRSLNVTPSGRVLPCHAAESIPGLQFWSVLERPLLEIWRRSPAFQAFRGTDWMAEPCRSCEMREIDFGGCRCQAMAITGDPRATDPACELSSHHELIQAIAEQDASGAVEEYVYRGRPTAIPIH